MVRRPLLITAVLATAGAGVAAGVSAAPEAASRGESAAPAVERPAVARPARRPATPPSAQRSQDPPHDAGQGVRWRRSRAVGTPEDGRLVRGVLLPAEGPAWFTWDPILSRTPSRSWRRHGTDRLVRVLLEALADYARRHPDAPRVGVGDLSRPRGGDFGPRYGIVGHVSHQNGLDADLYYPRRDGRERPALVPPEMDRRLAQDLVDALVRAGAAEVLVGPGTGLRGRRGVVRAAAGHDNHLHVRVEP